MSGGKRVPPPEPLLISCPPPAPRRLPLVPGQSSAACPPPRPRSWYSRWAPRPSAGRPAAPGPACAGCEGETFRASGPWGGTRPRARYHRGSSHSTLCLLGTRAPNPAGTRAGLPTRWMDGSGRRERTQPGDFQSKASHPGPLISKITLLSQGGMRMDRRRPVRAPAAHKG